MSIDELSLNIKEHQADLNGLMEQIHCNIFATISTAMPASRHLKISFEGMALCLDEDGDFVVDIGRERLESIPKEDRLSELIIKVATAQTALESFKREMKDIIQLARDIPAEKLDVLREHTKFLITLELMMQNERLEDRFLSRYEELARKNGFQLKVISYEPMSRSGSPWIMDAFTLEFSKPTIEELELRATEEFAKQLLALYKQLYVKITINGLKMMVSRQPHECGMPYITESNTCIHKGYLKKVGEVEIVKIL